MNFLKLFLILIICNLASFSYGQEESDFDKANKLFKKGKIEQAKVIIDKGLKESPLDADLLMLKGKYYHTKGENDKARFCLMKAVELDPNNVDAKQILVNVEMATKHYSAAICYVNELLEVNPYWKGLWRKKIDLYKLQGNDEEANRLLKRLIQIYPEDHQLQDEYKSRLQIEVNSLGKSGNIEKTLEKTEELLKIRKNTPEAYLDVINTFLKAGDKEKALIYTNRGLLIAPDNIEFIKKKCAILTEMGNVNEAMFLLKSKMHGNADLTKMYNDILLINARTQKQNDPYILYSNILERDPKNKEALSFLLSTAMSKGYYMDAIGYIAKAKKIYGSTKDILFKEYTLYVMMGDESKSSQLLVKLHDRFPEDTNIEDLFLYYQFKLGKQYVEQKQNWEALNPLLYIYNAPKNEYSELTAHLLLNIYIELGRNQEALEIADSLIASSPDNTNYFKKISVLVELEKLEPALDLYEKVINELDEKNRSHFITGYEELALNFTKELMDAGQTEKAYLIIERILALNPKNETAYKYGMNNSFRTHDKAMFIRYSKAAKEQFPEDIYFISKYAEGLFYVGKIQEADSVISPIFNLYPYNKTIIDIKTQISLSQCKILFKDKKGDSLLNLTNLTLKYNPNEVELKYYKGLAFELNKDYDSAYYYQAFYQPSVIEANQFYYHLNWLEYKTFKNQFSFSHLRSRFAEDIYVSGISNIEYTRFHNKRNTFTSRAYYAGRTIGASFLIQGEWTRELNNNSNFMLNAGYGTNYFPRIILNGNINMGLKNDYELQLGAGYRELPKVYTLMSGVIGLTKRWEKIWVNPKMTIYSSKNSLFYNALLNSRFYLYNEGRSYIQAMASFGSIPESGALDLSLYNTWNAFNTSVGLGFQHMISSRLTVGFLASWFNIKKNKTDYRNLYNLNFNLIYSL